MRCFIKHCCTKSTGKNGRVICVEPDNDGWICEKCWQFLNTGEGTDSAAYFLGQPEVILTPSPDVEEDDLDEIDNILRADFARQIETMNEGDEIDVPYELDEYELDEFDTIMSHMEANGTSRLSYDNLVYSKGMDRVRSGRLAFHNFGITEKVYLKRVGVSLWQGDTYDRDACRCVNFACDIRWKQATRSEDWTSDEEYVRYLELIEHFGRDIRPINSAESLPIRESWPSHF